MKNENEIILCIFHSVYVIVPCHFFIILPSHLKWSKSDLFSSNSLLLIHLSSLVNISIWKIRSREIYMPTQVIEH